jgi:hypothetical protein
MLFNTMIRVKSYQSLNVAQVLHGCRQFVLLSVWLTPINERNPHYRFIPVV